MIASQGGAIIDSKNNRTYPGSGGFVGGLSLPGRNNAWIGGAGEVYNSFTPDSSVYIPTLPGDGGSGSDCTYCRLDTPGMPQGPSGPGSGPGPGSELPTTGNVPQGPGTTQTPGTGTTAPTPTPTVNQFPDVVRDTINRLIDGLGMRRTRVNDSGGPLFLYTPQQPQAGGSGGLDMRSLIVWGALIGAGWFAYKKWVK